jgi:hypothetical protein
LPLLSGRKLFLSTIVVSSYPRIDCQETRLKITPKK